MKQFLIAFFIICMAVPVTAQDWQVGDIPPDFVGRGVKGNKVYLSEMKGKVVVITFWATWCAPCMTELPILDSIQRQVSSDYLQVVAVNFGEGRVKV